MRILIVDDEFVSLQKLSLFLKDKGNCDAATHGKQAYDMFCQAFRVKAPYQLVTLDFELPDFNGSEVLKKIREFEIENGITAKEERVKIIMMTSKNDGPSIMASYSGGCDGYITKPYSKEDVLMALTSVSL